MKSLLGKLGVILIGLSIFGCAKGWGADWIYYGECEFSLHYYDSESISRPSKNIVIVWTKSFYSEKGKIRLQRIFTGDETPMSKSIDNVGYSLDLEEINCESRLQRTLSTAYYSMEDKNINSYTRENQKWNFISLGSVTDSLHKAVCK
jgi:hypothetical protein